MTTAAQVKRALKSLLGSHPDLTLVDRWIIVSPVQHVVRAVLIDRTSDRDVFEPKWCVMHLFEVRRSIFLNWGAQIYPPRKGLWLWQDPDAVPALLNVIEQTALPRLKSIGTISDLVAQLPDIWPSAGPSEKPPLDSWPATKVIVDVALGDLASARSICVDKIARWSEATYGRDEEDKAELRRLKELCARLAADDRQGLAQLLHEWEAITVRNLKLEHVWEPTPFPLEQQGARG